MARSEGAFPFMGGTRSLVWELTKREVLGRYRGLSLGTVWSVLQPFLLLAVYTIAFGEILGARWPGASGTSDFALMIFVGLGVHGLLSECMNRGHGLVVGNVAYVKRIVFPLDVLPWPVLLSSLLHFAANVLVLLVVLLVMGRPLHWQAVLLPVVVAPLCLVAMGTMWMLASANVYVRDIGSMVPPVVTALFFLSSAIVPVEAVPSHFQPIFTLNPLTQVIDNARAVLLLGQLPEWRPMATYGLFAVAWYFAGYAAFSRLRRGFANVL